MTKTETASSATASENTSATRGGTVIAPESALKLVKVVQQLSLVRTLEQVMEIVRHAARELTGADGATFILREGENCHYADEDAISPLWKGKRFPMESCVSGWSMLHRAPVIIEDIYGDPRVLHAAYRPTFVKSVAMVPIRREAPIGAIGNYWATRHAATAGEIELLQALADSASIALENVQVYAELEQRVQERTADLEQANQDLEAFTYTAAHDLRAPVRHISAFTELLVNEGECGPKSLGYVDRIKKSSERLGRVIEDTLNLARISRARLERRAINLSHIAEAAIGALRSAEPGRDVTVTIAPDLQTEGDPGLLRIVLDNLVGNAWKFTARQPAAQIAIGAVVIEGQTEFFVRDNGVGFDTARAARLFQPFERFHSDADFGGTGVGLATVQRIIAKHGGSIRAASAPGKGATFFFTLG